MDTVTAGLIFGVVILYFGIRGFIQYFKENKNYTTTTATIIRYEQSVDHNSRNHMTTVGYTPIFEYKYNGKIYEEEHRVTSSKYGKGMSIVPASKYNIGDVVKVRVYDDGETVRAVIDDKNNIKMPLNVGIVFTILGVILIGMGIYFKMK
ncbi:MAG: DUF3592 domain-containing protein [Eubacterium sp.]|nr:DUF3592 domain-containing protein [Eubacterium sp.]